ncbi:MAG: hypothetical protein ACK55I_45560, partial [bacterium]
MCAYVVSRRQALGARRGDLISPPARTSQQDCPLRVRRSTITLRLNDVRVFLVCLYVPTLACVCLRLPASACVCQLCACCVPAVCLLCAC